MGRRAALLSLCLVACGDDDAGVDARPDGPGGDAAPAAPCSAEVVIQGNGIDVQIPVTFDTTAEVTSGRMQSDCHDLRVQTENGFDHPFWLESGCGTAATRLWFRSAAVAPGSVFLSWGYPTRPRASSVTDTFRGVIGEEGDLAAAWPMEDEDASLAADATGGGHDGALVGEPGRSEYAYGRTLVLDGIDDAMLVADAAVFDSSAFTFEARIWPEDVVENAIAARNDFSNTAGWTLWVGHPSNPERVFFQHAGASETVTIAGTQLGATHVALSYDGATVRLFVNGVLDGEVAVASLAESFDDELRVGTTNGTASDGTPFLRGQVDDVRFWSKALPEADVVRLYQHRGTYVTPALPGRVLLLDRGIGVEATVLRARCSNDGSGGY